jgi:hypothetical protein
MKAGMEGFISIEKFEIQYTLSPSHPPRRRRKDLYIFDFNDKKVNEKISVEGIDGDETDGDEGVNMEEDAENFFKEVGRKVVRIRSDREMKRARISLPYHERWETGE